MWDTPYKDLPKIQGFGVFFVYFGSSSACTSPKLFDAVVFPCELRNGFSAQNQNQGARDMNESVEAWTECRMHDLLQFEVRTATLTVESAIKGISAMQWSVAPDSPGLIEKHKWAMRKPGFGCIWGCQDTRWLQLQNVLCWKSLTTFSAMGCRRLEHKLHGFHGRFVLVQRWWFVVTADR